MPHVMISKKKCTACHMCELACSAYHENAYRPTLARLRAGCKPTTAETKGCTRLRLARVRPECNPTTAEPKAFTCLQTGCAKCQEACPNDAIVTKVIPISL